MSTQGSTPDGDSDEFANTLTPLPSHPDHVIVDTPPMSQGEGIDDSVDSSLELKRKRLKSIVWEHFTKKIVNGLNKAECKHCKKLLGGDAKNGTKHLHEHIKRCPRRRVIDMRQQVITNNWGRNDVNSMTVTSFNAESGRKELASMIIMHEYPLSMVEHVGFRRYSCILQPLFKVPSRNTLKNDCIKMYDCEKAKVKKLLESNESRVAITTDMWTASHQRRGFMAVTAHFIDSSWRLQSRVVRFIYVPCPHTKDVICDVLVQTLLDWNIDSKLSTITVDNCSTNDSMMALILDKLETRNLILSGTLLHMRCCAHVLNLVVQDGLSIIKEGIEKIRDSVAYWSATPKRQEKFQEQVKLLHLSCTKKLSLDCPTRWNSTFLMLEIALSYKEVFPRLKLRDSGYKSLPTDDQWDFAEEVCYRLKIFYDTTELFSGTLYPTTNLFFPKICEIKLALEEWVLSSNELVSKMAHQMLEKFTKYWDVIHGVLGVAAVLDPQYKMTLLEFYFPKLYGSRSDSELERIRQLCYRLVNEYNDKLNKEKERAHDSSFSTQSSSSCGVRLTSYDKYVLDLKRSRTSSAKTELDHYLEEDVLPRSDDFEILTWWKVHGVKYPTIKAIARDILAIPVSTVASESAFSTSGRLVSPHRNRLHPDTLEALMCTQNWLWASEPEFKDGGVFAKDAYSDINDDVDMEELENCCED